MSDDEGWETVGMVSVRLNADGTSAIRIDRGYATLAELAILDGIDLDDLRRDLNRACDRIEELREVTAAT